MRRYLTHELSALNLDCEFARTEFLGPSDPVAFNGCETDSSRFHALTVMGMSLWPVMKMIGDGK